MKLCTKCHEIKVNTEFHIKPDCSFNYSNQTDSELQELWQLDNLRPLWARDNLRKALEDRKLSIFAQGRRVDLEIERAIG